MLTPMMQQLKAAREQYPGMLVFFQNGEFYELFGDDAHLGNRVLGLTLTAREGTPMAGFPLAKLDHYLRLLLNAGHRVAVCEQMEPPGGGKIIRREVTRVATLGTITEDELLDPRRPNHLVAVTRSKQAIYGVAWTDLSTGTFHRTTATDALKRHFQVATLSGFGFDDGQPCLAAAGAILLYLQETLKASLAHLRRLRPHRPEAFLALD